MNRLFVVQDEEKMIWLGKRLASFLKEGDFVALIGNLGSGKSVFVRGAASYFGIDHLSSPTFTIVQEYPTNISFFHFDAYRIQDEFEMLSIGFDDYIKRKGIIFMEWADLVPGLLPDERMEIQIEGSGSEERKMLFTSYGKHYDEILKEI